MTMRYQAEPDPSEAALERIARWAPLNPFYTAAYAAARRARGEQPWLLVLEDGADGAIAAACTAFFKGPRLVVPSVPSMPEESDFWPSLSGTCREISATRLLLNSYASEPGTIPTLGQSFTLRARREFHLELGGDGVLRGLSSNHKRNRKRAEKAGVAIAPIDTREACQVHARLISASMQRRADRGEAVDTEIGAHNFEHFVAAGAGRLFQASLEGQVFSSILVLGAARGAYYHSAGTTPEGMKCGASHLLICEVAQRLATEGITRFNLGGAGEEEVGLTRFKTGFGPQPVDLVAAEARFPGGLKERILVGLKGLRSSS
ncbi:MAG: GNAT family N-acetyltransferase [Pseudomonadota bacterium]